MRRVPIRMKLALALALPLLALVIVTAIAVQATADDTWLIVLTVAAVGAAVLLAFVVSRSITEPLRSLTAQAKEMSEHRLPGAVIEILETPLGDDVRMPQATPVAVRARDEVGDVADALNSVQDTALRLAVEQAVLRRNIADSFVNLGRRNQNLLGRQLDFITELESHETDPDTLASLFRLDHLATRMRRNAESLLVLAGIEPSRKWAAPVRLTDVIRAALGEVEDYQRVTMRDVVPATVLGSVAADLAHLVAEFVENSLTFSPPEEMVSVSGRPVESGYRLAVVDHGLGMDEDDIAQANRRLVGAERFTIAPSKYLGHYVAGNLAARHGVRVRLANLPGTGVAATIDLPPAILTADAPVGDPITDPNGTRPVASGAPRRPPTPDAGTPAPMVPPLGSPIASPVPTGPAPAMPAPDGPGPAMPTPDVPGPAMPTPTAPASAAPASFMAVPAADLDAALRAGEPAGVDPGPGVPPEVPWAVPPADVPLAGGLRPARPSPPLLGGPETTPRLARGRTASGLAKRERRGEAAGHDEGRGPSGPDRAGSRRSSRAVSAPTADTDALLASIARALPHLADDEASGPEADTEGRDFPR
jgi:signal transduction histidine kinase